MLMVIVSESIKMSIPHRVFKKSLPVIATIAVSFVALVSINVFYLYEMQELQTELVRNAEGDLRNASKEFGVLFGSLTDELKVISESPSFKTYVANPTPENVLEVQSLFQAFSRNHDSFHQLRYLDLDGHERIRVDEDGVTIEQDALQSKADRYYFREGMQMPPGIVYVSPIDLNIEHGVIEYPYVPTIRFVLPVEDREGIRRGCIVLNHDTSSSLLLSAETNYSTHSTFQILNLDGYWILHGKDSSYAWGWMLEGQSGKCLPKLRPELWYEIEQENEGQRWADGGLQVWKKISSYSLANFSKSNAVELSDQWILMIEYSQEGLDAEYAPIQRMCMGIAVIPVMIGAFFIFFVLKHQKQREIVEAINYRNSQILKYAQVAVISTNPEGKITSVNEAASALFQVAPEEMVGRLREDYYEDAEALRDKAAELSRAYNRTIPVGFETFAVPARIDGKYLTEWTIHRSKGDKVPTLMAVSAIKTPDHRIEGYLEVTVDITQQKEVEAALEKARMDAESLARIKAEFLANMSHEIRTPMNGVIGLSNLLLNTDLDENQQTLAQTIVKSAEVLLTVINDILDYSKLESGALEIEEAPVDLYEVVENAMLLFAPQASLKSLELINECEPNLQSFVIGDGHRLTQVISNLVGNAIKFTEKGEVKLRVTTERLGNQRVNVRFSISDTGIGMDSETCQRIFQPFTQADASTTRKFGGTGLGLAITTQLIGMMGGKIDVKSQPGQGTTFWFELPMMIDPNADSAIGKVGGLKELSTLRALVVDDNEANLLVLRSQLEAIGMEVDGHLDSRMALREIQSMDTNYAVVILDNLMPEMNGLELAKAIHAARPHLSAKVLILSSSGRPIDTKQRQDAGVDAYLIKPVSPRQLSQTLVQLLADCAKPDPAKPAPEISKEAERKSLRIIMADDDSTNRMVMQLQLRSLGFELELVQSGAELLKALEEKPYDIVLLDCQMPGKDGFEIAREIRHREATIGYYPSGRPLWVVAATAFAFSEDRERSLEAGMNDFLSKPAKIPDIKEMLSRFQAAQA